MRNVVRALIAAGVILILLPGILFLFLQSATGKSLLISALTKNLNSEPDLKVKFGRIEGIVPFDIQLSRFSISDADGEWLDAHGLALKWSLLSLLKGSVRIDRLHIASLAIDRAPAGEKKEQPFPPEIPPQLERLRSLTVSDLSVEDLAIGQSILGQSAVFGLKAALGDAGSEPGRVVSLHVKRKDAGPDTNADIEMVLDKAPAVLSVNAVFKEEEGGAVGAVLGLSPGPLHLEVQGDGPLKDWKGTVRGSSGAYGSISAEIGLKAGETNVLTLGGRIEPVETILPPRLAPVLGGDNVFSLALNFIPSKSITVDKGWMWGKGYHFESSGRIDLESREFNSAWTFSLHALPVSDSSGLAAIRELTARGDLSGTTNRPQGTATVLLRDIRQDGSMSQEIITGIQLHPPHGQDIALSTGVRLLGTTRAVRADGGVHSENELSWSADLRSSDENNLVFLDIQAENQKNTFKLSGRLNTVDRSGNLEASVKVEDFTSLQAFTGMEIPGSFDFEANISATGFDSISGRFQGQMRRIPSPGDILGPESTFSGKADLKGSVLDVSEFHIKSPHLEFNSRMQADLSDRRMKGDWRLALPNLAPLEQAAGISLSGSIEGTGAFTGAFDALEHSAILKGDGLVLSGKKLPPVLVEISASKAPESPEGNIRLEMRRDNEKLSVSTDFSLRENRLRFSSLHADAPGAKIRGEAGIDLEGSAIEGALEGSFTDLGALGRIAGERLEGSGSFRVEATPGEKGPNIKARAGANNLGTRLGNVKKITLSADLKDIFEIPRGSLNLELQEYSRSGLLLKEAGLKLTGDKKGVSFDGAGNGKYSETFDFRAGGELTRTAKASARLRLGSLGGRYGDRPFKLLEPLVLNSSAGKVSFERLSLQYGPGRLTGSGSLDAKRVLLEAGFEKFPVETPSGLNAPDLTGAAAGRFRLEGDPSRPSASLDLNVTGIRSKMTGSKKSSSSSLNIEARLSAGSLQLKGELRSVTERPVRANLETQLSFSLMPFAFSLPATSPLRGDLSGEADLAFLTTFLPVPDHELTGRATAGFTIGGTVQDPELNGTINVNKGTYQNLPYGTVLKDLDIEMAAVGRRLTIERARATDGAKGKFSATGWLQFDGPDNIPMAFDLTMADLALVRRHDATGVIDGSIRMSGWASGMSVSGQLEVKSAELLLQRRQPPAVVELEVIEVHGGKPLVDEREQKTTPPLFNRIMDIRISLPGNVMVRGRGLDSEWRGELRLTGSGGRESFTGNLSTVRGTFDFLGKNFKVTSGAIAFYGAFPPEPVLDITAEARARDITARLLLRGPANSLDIKLDSDPPLPSDEILSRVLFNRETNKITPIQALRLAEGLRSLSGRGDALDFLGRTREFLGLGQLELRETGREPGLGSSRKEAGEDKGIGLGIGKYLTEDIYVDVEKGVGSDSGKLSVRVEITPQVTLETEAGLDDSKGIGLHWKRDY